MASTYDHKTIEAKWQDRWEKERVAEMDLDRTTDTYYMLMMFPYPSGDRLHVGHGRNYILGDALYRYLRMKGRRALNPMGWDAFGLPAENAAIKRGVHPKDSTLENIARMKVQFRRWGILYDWSKEIASCTPEYYRWNQWLFLKMLEKGLAYRRHAPVNWCPSCQTVLANEQVVDGACERCSTPVEQKELEQWFYRITDYAERLLGDLDRLEGWSDKVKVMQRNWIGRSEGAEIDFEIPGVDGKLTVFTTRPDTIHGATFMVLAPEHPLVPELIAEHPERDEIRQWIDRVRNTPRIQREGEAGAKEGRDTGRVAVNPATAEEIPIWLANYVLPEYGSGAIMAVPAHDARDLEMARQEGLPVRLVYHAEDAPDEGATARRADHRRRRHRGRRSPVRRHGGGPGDDPRLHRLAGPGGLGPGQGDLPAARLADLAAALLGDADPGGLLRRLRPRSGPRGGPAGHAALRRRVQRPGRKPPGPVGGLRPHRVPGVRRPGAARDRHHGHLRRQLLVLPALSVAQGRPAHVRPGAGGGVVPGGPVHRRHRARHPAPALRALRLQGAQGLRSRAVRRAVHPPVQPGHDHPLRRHERAGGEDVQVEGQHGLPRRPDRGDGGRHRAGLHPLPRSAGGGGGVERRGGERRLPLPQPGLARRPGPRERSRDRAGRRRARARSATRRSSG